LHLADLVEQQGAAVRLDEQAGALLRRPGERPARMPNSSLSISSGGMAAQLSGTKGASRRGLSACSARATSSFPVPLSPVMITGPPSGATWRIASNRRRIGALRPTMPWNSPSPSSLRYCETSERSRRASSTRATASRR
jgi:hypothetical protein